MRSLTNGHSALHELLAQIRDASVTAASGYRYSGKPKPYPRPGHERPARSVDLTNPEDRAAIGRFFGS